MTILGLVASIVSFSVGQALAKLTGMLTAWTVTATCSNGSSGAEETPNPCSAMALGTSTAGLTSTPS